MVNGGTRSTYGPFSIGAEINLVGTLPSLILTILPIKCNLLLVIWISIFLLSKNFIRTDLFVIFSSITSSHFILIILLRHLIWNTSIFLKFFVINQLPQPRRKIFNGTFMKIWYFAC